MTPSQGVSIRIMTTVSGNPLHNIRLLPQGINTSSQFHPDLLARLAGFGVLRFSGKLDTSEATGVNAPRLWGARPSLQIQTQAGKKGMAMEYAIMLANEVCNCLLGCCFVFIPTCSSERRPQTRMF